MDYSLYNPKLSWYKMPENIEYIKILKSQGVSTFDPVSFYNEAKISNSENINVNVADLKKKDKKKLKVSKSAEKIIKENNKKKEIAKRAEEESKIESYLNKCENIEEMRSLIDRMKTDYGRIKAKAKLLEKSISDSLILEQHLLFFSLNSENEHEELKDDVKKVILKYKKLYKDKDLIEIQMNSLSSYLNPLNPLNKEKRKLDDWQVTVFEKIENKKNVLVVAPTSAGKTVCSTYCAVIGKRTLFVVPSDELARQVAGIFRNMQNIMVGIVTNKECYFDSDINVVVGTPRKLEEYLINNMYGLDDEGNLTDIISESCNFNYVIYDEIQMLNSEEGAAFENIIKLLNIPSLFLSATIDNPDSLKEWLEIVKGGEVNLVKYNKRFIVQQRYLWDNNNLNHLHPLSCMDLEYLQSGELLNSDLSFTPRDTFHLYNIISSKVDQTQDIKPHNILNKNKWDSIDLNDTIIVERHIKQFLTEISTTNPEITNEILSTYNVDEIGIETIDIINLIKILIKKNMCPAIFFKMDAFKCRTIFKYIVSELERKQNEKYPHHYDDMTLQYDALKEFNTEWQTEKEKIKIPQGLDPEIFKENVEKRIHEKHLNSLKSKFTQITNIRNEKIMASDIDERNKKFYINYYNNQLSSILGQSELLMVDKNMPHPEFTFNYMGIDSNTMRGIRRELKKTLGYDIRYTHPIMVGIERGIVPYFKDMEVPFQRIVQSLFSEKKIPIIISDESLGYGINMPIRTVVMLGDNNGIEQIDPLKANQMSGRSGRRGVDREGNIVYVNVNWKNILRGKFPKLTGLNPISESLPLPLKFFKLNEFDIDKLCMQTLYQFKNDINDDNKANVMGLINNVLKYNNDFDSELVWSCRYISKNYIMVPEMMSYMFNRKLLDHTETFKCIVTLFDEGKPYNNNLVDINFDTSSLFDNTELLTVYKENRVVSGDNSHSVLKRLKNIGFALAALQIIIDKNSNYKKKFDKLFNDVFNNIKELTFKYQF